jgi:S4 domain
VDAYTLGSTPYTVAEILVALGVAPSDREAAILVRQGRVRVNDVFVRDPFALWPRGPQMLSLNGYTCAVS